MERHTFRIDNRRHDKRASSCQTEQAHGFVLGKCHSSRSVCVCTSSIYVILPEANKTTLKVLFGFLGPLIWQSRSPRMRRNSLVDKYRRFRRTCCHLPIQTTWQHITEERTHEVHVNYTNQQAFLSHRYKHVSCFQKKDLVASRFATQTSGERPLSDKKAVSVWDQLPFIATTVFWQFGRPLWNKLL
jgi:hypothetical protein